MTTAFEITQTDVENVLTSNYSTSLRHPVEDIAEKMFEQFDFGLIEEAALNGDSLDEQIDYVNDEIKRQIDDMDALASVQSELDDAT